MLARLRLVTPLCGLMLLVSPSARAQITFVGSGAQTAATSGTVTPAIPSGTAAGDFAVLIVAGRPTDASEPAAPAGWTLRTSVLEEVGADDLKIMIFYGALAGGDANPVVTLPAAWTGSAAGMSGQIAVWRGVSATTPFDVADTTATSNAAASWTPAAITTVTADAWAVSAVATSDNNDVRLGSAAGFTERMSGTGYDTTTGGDHAVALADKLQSTAGAVAMPQWQQNANSSDDWVGITFALRPAPPAPPISYSFEETSWTGAAGEVIEDGYGLDGTAAGGATTANTTPAIATDPGSCRYGVFDGIDDYVQVADTATLDISNELTLAAWVRMRTTPTELHTIASKDTNYEYHINSSRQVYWWWNDSTGTTRSIATATAINLNQWYHIAVTYKSGTQVIYIDGVSSATSAYAGTLANNNLPFYIGTDWNFISRAFDGDIDEVRIIPRAYSAAEVLALRNATHPCPAAAAQFTINHDTFGINCVAETVTVNVIDSVAGTPLVNYNAQVQLEARVAGTGALANSGTWALVTGSGTFSDGVANDGIATYTWPLGQSQAVFTLYYPSGQSALDIDVFQISNPGIKDTEAEGTLTFYPNGFTVTAAALTNPPPGAITTFATNQTAGTNFTLYLAAYGQTPTDPTCGIIEDYTGTKSLKFWSTYSNPATGTRQVSITGTTTVSAATSEGASVAQNVVFTNGQASVVAKYKDVGQIQIAMKDDTVTNPSQLPTGIQGGTQNFVSRPADFVLSAISDPAGTLVNPQASDASGGVFMSAGSPFRATVTVRDAEGSTTPNYGAESTPETVRLIVSLVGPAGGASPAVGFTTGFGAFASGVATGTDFTWSEVGIVQLRGGVGDSSYLGAGDTTGTLSERIGRFIPNRFVVALNAPALTTQCAAGNYTYQGQSFGYATAPVITATAVSVNGTTTLNYRDTYFKLTNSTLTGRTYSTTSGGTLDSSGVPGTASDPTIATVAGTGVATLTFSSGTGLTFTKTLLAPFAAGIQLAINVLDADGVAAVGAAPLGNPVTFGSAGGVAFSAGDSIRYGRVRVGTAVGSERVDLPVKTVAEYYASAAAGFVTHANDVCTTGITLAFSGYTENLGAGETCARDTGAPGLSGVGCAAAGAPGLRWSEPPTAGDFILRLAAPGAGNNGSVVITATVPSWLQFDWNTGAAGDENPTGQATFGIYGGESRQIYTREIY